MRLIVTGGGTGGHINPALAIADAIREKEPGTEILFVGTQKGMESRIVPEYGYRMEYVDVMGIKRSLSAENIRAVIKAVKSVGEARRIIEKFRPDAVIGTGGYVCYPIMKAAAEKGIFTALHESNACPGLAVKILKNKVDRIYVNFEECAKELNMPQKVLRTGNPLRKGIDPKERQKERSALGITGRYRYLLLSFGGSLGAETVNREMLRLMKEFTSKRSDILHVHGCGKAGYESFMKAFCESELDKCKNLVPTEYIYDMARYMVSADLIVSRSGAMTLSEIACAGRASILIPSPNVTDDHQYKNAKAFADGGAAFAVRENAEELAKIPEYAETLLSDAVVRENMEKSVGKFAFYGAGETIADEIIKNVHKKMRLSR